MSKTATAPQYVTVEQFNGLSESLAKAIELFTQAQSSVVQASPAEVKVEQPAVVKGLEWPLSESEGRTIREWMLATNNNHRGPVSKADLAKYNARSVKPNGVKAQAPAVTQAPAQVKAAVAAGGSTVWGTFTVGGNPRVSQSDAAQMLLSDPNRAEMERISRKGWRLISLMGKKDNPNPANIMPADRGAAFKMQSIDTYRSQGKGSPLMVTACEIVRKLHAAGITVSDLNAQAETVIR